MGAYYGLRRSEILGLKWNAIDFEKRTIAIQHTIVRVKRLKTRHWRVLHPERYIRDWAKENILYDWHMKTDRDPEKELYHELYEVIRDMVIGERETVTVGKATYPYSYVRERFLSLTHEHLEYVRNEVVKNQGKIYCLKKFIETALFNAPATINTHYSQLYTYYEEGDGRQLWDAG